MNNILGCVFSFCLSISHSPPFFPKAVVGLPLHLPPFLCYLTTLCCVVTTSVGVDHIDLAKRRHHGIAITNANPAFVEVVIDYAVRLLLDVLPPGRSKNAHELYMEMLGKGFVPSMKAYNSMVNCLAIAGEVEEAVRILKEMLNRKRMPELITYQTVLDAIGRDGRVEEAVDLLRVFKERDLIDGRSYNRLLYGLQDEYGDHNKISRCSVR